jgi:hypothetical protein
MRIRVTDNHIGKGERRSIFCCPIALAIKKRIGMRNISVGIHQVRIEGKLFELPSEAKGFIEDFDTGRPVAPFTFDLPIEEVKESL